jgi:hypothetical protein
MYFSFGVQNHIILIERELIIAKMLYVLHALKSSRGHRSTQKNIAITFLRLENEISAMHDMYYGQ